MEEILGALPTTHPIESTFATIRHRATRTKDLFRNNPVKFYPGFRVRWCNSIPRGRGLFEDGRDSSGRR